MDAPLCNNGASYRADETWRSDDWSISNSVAVAKVARHASSAPCSLPVGPELPAACSTCNEKEVPVHDSVPCLSPCGEDSVAGFALPSPAIADAAPVIFWDTSSTVPPSIRGANSSGAASSDGCPSAVGGEAPTVCGSGGGSSPSPLGSLGDAGSVVFSSIPGTAPSDISWGGVVSDGCLSVVERGSPPTARGTSLSPPGSLRDASSAVSSSVPGTAPSNISWGCVGSDGCLPAVERGGLPAARGSSPSPPGSLGNAGSAASSPIPGTAPSNISWGCVSSDGCLPSVERGRLPAIHGSSLSPPNSPGATSSTASPSIEGTVPTISWGGGSSDGCPVAVLDGGELRSGDSSSCSLSPSGSVDDTGSSCWPCLPHMGTEVAAWAAGLHGGVRRASDIPDGVSVSCSGSVSWAASTSRMPHLATAAAPRNAESPRSLRSGAGRAVFRQYSVGYHFECRLDDGSGRVLSHRQGVRTSSGRAAAHSGGVSEENSLGVSQVFRHCPGGEMHDSRTLHTVSSRAVAHYGDVSERNSLGVSQVLRHCQGGGGHDARTPHMASGGACTRAEEGTVAHPSEVSRGLLSSQGGAAAASFERLIGLLSHSGYFLDANTPNLRCLFGWDPQALLEGNVPAMARVASYTTHCTIPSVSCWAKSRSIPVHTGAAPFFRALGSARLPSGAAAAEEIPDSTLATVIPKTGRALQHLSSLPPPGGMTDVGVALCAVCDLVAALLALPEFLPANSCPEFCLDRHKRNLGLKHRKWARKHDLACC
ncbi:hypothetical protein DIPPA_31441 [Diplonema papillatum]|nr:hypothetical protein DIPPA_31441 [Diplonema papillatum]